MSMFGNRVTRLGLSMWLKYQNKKCDVINSAINSTLFFYCCRNRDKIWFDQTTICEVPLMFTS